LPQSFQRVSRGRRPARAAHRHAGVIW
jgi:hypothetical protein